MNLNLMAQQHQEIRKLIEQAENTNSLNPLAGVKPAKEAAKQSHALAGSVLVELMQLTKRIDALESQQAKGSNDGKS